MTFGQLLDFLSLDCLLSYMEIIKLLSKGFKGFLGEKVKGKKCRQFLNCPYYINNYLGLGQSLVNGAFFFFNLFLFIWLYWVLVEACGI